MLRGPDHIAIRTGSDTGSEAGGLCAIVEERTTCDMHTALLAFVLMFQTLLAEGVPQPEEGAEEVRVHNLTMEVDGVTYAWAIMIPPGVEEGGPALLFLHGAGECGTDGKKNLEAGLPWHIRNETQNWPFVIIVPQKPTLESEWEDHAEAVLAMLDEAAEEGLYEPARLAITGLSQGGHGTIMIASMHPERFQAAAPVCGYVDRYFSTEGDGVARDPVTAEDEPVIAAAETLAKMPVWLFHGTLDDVVPPEESRALAVAIKERRGDVQFTEFKGANHNAWDPAYSNPELAEWFVEQTKE